MNDSQRLLTVFDLKSADFSWRTPESETDIDRWIATVEKAEIEATIISRTEEIIDISDRIAALTHSNYIRIAALQNEKNIKQAGLDLLIDRINHRQLLQQSNF